MTRLSMVAVILFTLFGCSNDGGSGTVGTVNDMLSSIPTGEELKMHCGTRGGGSSGTVCTSKFAFVCLKGWSACPLEGDNKTCCKKD